MSEIWLLLLPLIIFLGPFVVVPIIQAIQHEKFVDSLSMHEKVLMGFYTTYLDSKGKIKYKRNWRR